MKQIEYFYNVIYYFFYRATIKFALFVRSRYNPLVFFVYLFYNIPYIKNKFKKKGIDVPFEWHMGYDKNVEETSIGNTNVSAGTIIGAGFSISVIFFLYMGIYHIVKHLFFPTFEESNSYDIIIAAILAYLTDIVFTVRNDKSKKYIKEFNKKKGWWRTKWKIVAILSLLLSLWFSLETSSQGTIGKYLLSLNGNYTYPTAEEKLEQEKLMKLYKAGKL